MDGDPRQRECGDGFYDFATVIEREPEEYSPSLHGCFSNDRTVGETKRNMHAAIRLHVAALLTHREPVPQVP